MTLQLHAPQLIYIALLMIGIGIDTAKHGEPKTGNHNCTSSIIAAILTIALLYWGGFFG